MKDLATQLGFAFSRKGCPCNGTPLIYTQAVAGTLYTLTLWERRDAWRLTAKGCVLATGNTNNMTDKINHIFNL